MTAWRLQDVQPQRLDVVEDERSVGKSAAKLKPDELALLVHEALLHENWPSIRKTIAADGFAQVLALGKKELESLKSVDKIFCPSCEMSKKVKHSLPAHSRMEREERELWETVYADHCGPFPPQAGGGQTHITAFLEGKHDMSYLFRGGIPRAATTVECYESLDNLVRRTCDGIENLRTDEGADWTSDY